MKSELLSLSKGILISAAVLALAGCTAGDYFMDGKLSPSDSIDCLGSESSGDKGESGGDGTSGSNSGKLTAGEWNDLNNWDFWGNLLNNKDFSSYQTYWGFNTSNRFAVKVTLKDGTPAVGVELVLSKDGKEIWKARTDNHGEASLWSGLYDEEASVEGAEYKIGVDGVVQEGSPECTALGTEIKLNEYVVGDSYKAPKGGSDIAFIVDATGSMGDEIKFLKDDLLEVLNLSEAQVNSNLRTAALFYRDVRDDYLTLPSDFTADFSSTVNFIKKQNASGGGDFPEAVHTALEDAVQKLSWSADARTKVAFLVLDAPAHQNHQGVLESLHESISLFAEQGIRIIPVLASGADKDTEFMCRFFAIATGGTYTFLTDDSGISAGSHVIPSVGEFKVELLKDLMLRLIVEYCE